MEATLRCLLASPRFITSRSPFRAAICLFICRSYLNIYTSSSPADVRSQNKPGRSSAARFYPRSYRIAPIVLQSADDYFEDCPGVSRGRFPAVIAGGSGAAATGLINSRITRFRFVSAVRGAIELNAWTESVENDSRRLLRSGEHRIIVESLVFC